MTMTIQFTIDLEQAAMLASRQAAEDVFVELNGRFQDAIGRIADWNWPRDTVRWRTRGKKRMGKGVVIPAGPRNIKEWGTLQRSNTGPIIRGLEVEFRWPVPYATAVHEGARIYPWGNKKRKVTLPARPWTSAVLGKRRVGGIPVYPLRSRYRALWLAHFKANRKG